MKPYPEYKASAITSLGNIPAHWTEDRAKYYFREMDCRSVLGTEEMLSVSHITGVTPRNQKNVTMFKAESNVGQKICQPDDVVINTMWAWMSALGVSRHTGIVSPSYGVYRPHAAGIYDGYYLDHLLRIEKYRAEYVRHSTGIRSSRLRLYPDKFLSMRLLCPPIEEQQTIAHYLKAQNTLFNKFIRNKRRLIALLKEQKQNIINIVVTRGLDPNIKMRPSGVDWLGDIPEHWGVRKLKHIAAMKSGDNLTSEQISDEGNFKVYGGNGLRGYYHTFNKHGNFLLVGRQGALCGNVHHIQGKFWATEHAIVTAVRERIDIDWYFYMLIVMNLNQYSESAAQPGLSVEKIQNLRTTVPSLAEQQALVKHIKQETATIDTAISRAEREIELMREYRDRLIADVVTGQVDVRGMEAPEISDSDLMLNEIYDLPEVDDAEGDDAED